MGMSEPSPSRDALGLGRFMDSVRGWFLSAFEEPTPVQREAWEAVEKGENALVIAPTGSGKTLAAFLFAIDSLMREKTSPDATAPADHGGEDRSTSKGSSSRRGKGRSKGSTRILYVSPLKALGADVERNLQEPLAAIAGRVTEGGGGAPAVRTGMRTGDTTPEQRRSLQRNPPDILITTPESLYLMLTSKAREGLRTVQTVIVDEVHALAGNKRGAHLALSLERLDDLLERPAQRIGLSATVRPRKEVARFLGGSHPVRIVASEGDSDMDVRVIVPVRDMTDIPAHSGAGDERDGNGRDGGGFGRPRVPFREPWRSDRALRAVMADQSQSGLTPDSRIGTSSLWPFIEASILDEVLSHRTTIVFVNSRGLCEKLTARLNELYAQRCVSASGRGSTGVDVPAAAGLPGAPSHLRSDLGSTTELSQGAPAIIAKAHHGSVSKEKRLQVEHELKTGQVPCVVATSSLELGIDMGSIDLVLQVAAPPSVASGLQRIGRANHRVGGRSEGAIYPRTRTEIIDAAVVVEGMASGLIEETALIRNPLDVLSQQTVAAVALGEISADAWYETVCRAASFSELPRRAFDSVLDMLAGRHASTDLAELSPRIVWDRTRGMLVPRPGTQRHAVMTAGTIPDRGMFSVVLPEGGGEEGRRRVGELDEEMVYESRVGDVIALGTSSWRISEITRDRVIVEPAPGRSARLPFWHGEGVGRPAETGKAKGAFLHDVARGIMDTGIGCPVEADDAVLARLAADGLNVDAQRNMVELLGAQRAATGIVPDGQTLVVEQCEDEVGDWRVMLHSPYGRRVHEPWAMAVADRVMRTQGFDPQVTAADDGIVLRIPAVETRLPGAELFAFDPDELDRIVRDRVGSTALFAARFRECAARALLMPPAAPGKRAPLWQQRLRAGQLLEAARQEQDFPLLLETARECLQDVYDMPSLHMLMERLQAGMIHLVEKRTSVPSPFAAPLLFGYVGEHLYQGDLPHAEQRASLLSLDPTLLGELLGSVDMAELLDPSVIRSVEDDLQHVSPERRVRGAEGVADLLRVLGPLSVEEVARRLMSLDGQDDRVPLSPHATEEEAAAAEEDVLMAAEERACAALGELHDAHRAFPATVGGQERWLSADDAGRVAEALGIEVPPWAPPAVFAGGAAGRRTPLDDLIVRHARTHGPFSAEEVARRWGLGRSIVRESLDRLAAVGTIIGGRFGREEGTAEERSWVSAEVFKRLRSLSLAKARRAVRAVDGATFVRFLLDLQGIGTVGEARFEGIEGTADVIAQFEGVFLPAASWESQVLPSRVRDYRPSMLDELLVSGDILWVGDRREGDESEGLPGERRGGRPAGRGEGPGLVAFFPTDSPLAPERFDPMGQHVAAIAPDGLSASERLSVDAAIVGALSLGGGLFFNQIVESVRHRLAPQRVEQADIVAALEDLTWSGRVTNDTFAPARFAPAKGGSRPAGPARRRVSSRRSRLRSAEVDAAARSGVAARVHGSGTEGAALSGRWSLLVPAEESDAVRGIALVDSLLDRYGVLSRDVAALSGVPGGMVALYPVLRSMEDAGEVLRGVFVEGFGPAQFAARETVDLLRTYAADTADPPEGEGSTGVLEDGARGRQTLQVDRGASSGIVVLAADDPACLFGAGIPWPPVADGEGSEDPATSDLPQSPRPSRRAGSLVAVSDGTPVIYATAGLRSMLAFTADAGTLSAAVDALVAQVTRSVKRAPDERARKKILVETFNGRSVLSTSFADLLHASGFVRLPDGMRLYVLPF